MWQACVLLEKSLLSSESNSQIKLLLLKVYCLLGAFGACPALYESLDIKHMLHDSLGFVVTNHVQRLGHSVFASTLYETVLRFFSANQREIAEQLVQCYKYGTFTKVSCVRYVI